MLNKSFRSSMPTCYQTWNIYGVTAEYPATSNLYKPDISIFCLYSVVEQNYSICNFCNRSSPKTWTSAARGGMRAHPSHPPCLRACNWGVTKTLFQASNLESTSLLSLFRIPLIPLLIHILSQSRCWLHWPISPPLIEVKFKWNSCECLLSWLL